MKVKSRKNFFKDLGSIKSRELLDHVQFLYNMANSCEQAEDIPGFKWLTGYPNYARISIEEYRIGVQVTGQTIIFFCVLHRSVVYKQFP